MNRRQLLSLGGLAATGTLAGCNAIPGLSNHPVNESELSVVRVRPRDSGKTVDIEVVLELSNPTDSELPSPSGELTASIDGTELTSASPSFETVAPNDSVQTTATFSKRYTNMTQETGARIFRGKFTLGLTGKIRSEGNGTDIDLTYDYTEPDDTNSSDSNTTEN